MSNGIIYCAINKINNKMYIGYSEKSLEQRKKWHEQKAKKGSEFYFHVAMRKYGFDSFTWKILDVASSIEELQRLEMEYICMFGSSFKGVGYNLTEGGEGVKGNVTTREKIRRAKLGQLNPSYGQKGKKAFHYGHKHTLETRLKLSEITKNLKWTGSSSPSAVRVLNVDTKEMFGSVIEAADKYQTFSQNIVKCCKGQRLTCEGYHWRYL